MTSAVVTGLIVNVAAGRQAADSSLGAPVSSQLDRTRARFVTFSKSNL
jgi:hypothetical protein